MSLTVGKCVKCEDTVNVIKDLYDEEKYVCPKCIDEPSVTEDSNRIARGKLQSFYEDARVQIVKEYEKQIRQLEQYFIDTMKQLGDDPIDSDADPIDILAQIHGDKKESKAIEERSKLGHKLESDMLLPELRKKMYRDAAKRKVITEHQARVGVVRSSPAFMCNCNCTGNKLNITPTFGV